MKQLSPALKSHIESGMTQLITCWKLTRRDGTIMGFTEHDQDITFNTLTYKAATGFTPTAIATSAELGVNNLDIDGILSDDSITEADIHAGRYDYAEIEVFQVNHEDPNAGNIILSTGWLGEINIQHGRFVAEVRGLTQQLSTRIGELYSPVCRARFGDARCGIDLDDHTVTGNITSSTSRHQCSDDTRSEVSQFFAFGTLTFTSGANSGITLEVKQFQQGGNIIFALPAPYDIAVGVSYRMTAGCDKRFSTCRDRFTNVVNFRGEPHIPGIDKILETSSTRSL